MSWAPGDVVVRRDLWRGRLWYAVAAVVVTDDGERLVTYSPPGSEMVQPAQTATEFLPLMAAGRWTLVHGQRYNHTLGFSQRDAGYSIAMFWSEENWEFLGWYVNLEAPMKRTAIGGDTCDYHLDVVLGADGKTWAWKDEDHIDQAVQLGLFTAEQVAEMRREASSVVDWFLRGDEPFTAEWAQWRPNPAWPIPRLPHGWDTVIGD